MTKKALFNLSLFIVFLLTSGIISVMIGQFVGWDMTHHHLYSPHAFLNNRFDMDFMVAGGHSYLNPLLAIPYYLMLRTLTEHTKLIAFIQGFYYGILAFIFWHISLKFFKMESLRDYFFHVTAFFIGITNTVLIAQIGSTSNDIQVSAGILLSVYILMCYLFAADSKKRFAFILLSGIVAGASGGLKMTMLPFCATIFITIALNYKQTHSPKRTLFLFLVGCTLGFLLVNGFWMYQLYMKFESPMFPMFNEIFQSPYYPLDNSNTFDRQLKGLAIIRILLIRVLFFPFFWHIRWVVSCEAFLDFRYVIAYIMMIFLGIKASVLKIKGNNSKTLQTLDYYQNVKKFIIVFIVTSYILWIYKFSAIRYFLPVACLTGIIIVIFVKTVFKSIGFKYQALLVCSLMFFVLATSYFPYRTGRDLTWQSVTKVEDLNISDGALVFINICDNLIPSLSYITVFQNPKAHYIGVALSEGDRHLGMWFTKEYFSAYERAINRILRGLPNSNRKVYFITNLYGAYRCEKIKILKENSRFTRISQPLITQALNWAIFINEKGFMRKDYYLLEVDDPIFFEWVNYERTKVRFREVLSPWQKRHYP